MKLITYKEKIIKNKPGSFINSVEVKNRLHETLMHWHDEFEIVECLCEGTLWLAGKTFKFKSGDFLIIGSKQPHKISGKGLSNFTALLIDTQFIKANDGEFLKKITSFAQKLTKIAFIIPDGESAEFAGLYRELFNAHKKNGQIFTEIGICFKLFSIIEENYLENVPVSGEEDEIKDIISYIGDSYSDNITLNLLSEKFNMGKYSLIKKFKRYTGMTPIQYVINTRLQNAYFLLKNGVQVTEAALMCGFDNMSYFTRRFYKKYNICPKNVKNL